MKAAPASKFLHSPSVSSRPPSTTKHVKVEELQRASLLALGDDAFDWERQFDFNHGCAVGPIAVAGHSSGRCLVRVVPISLCQMPERSFASTARRPGLTNQLDATEMMHTGTPLYST